jgi:hypothetical protein
VDSVKQEVIGPTAGIVVYLITSPTQGVQCVGSTRNMKRRRLELDSYLRYMPSGCVVVTVGPFTARADAYQVEDLLLRTLAPPLNTHYFVPSSRLVKEQ